MKQYVCGAKQVLAGLKNETLQAVYIAKEADLDLLKEIVKLATESNVEIIYKDTLQEVGKLCNIDVGSAASGLIKEVKKIANS